MTDPLAATTERHARTDAPYDCAPLIKEIGRGPNGARALSRDAAAALYLAMLDGRVEPTALGAVLIAYRLKGETAAELAGMLDAAHARVARVTAPAGAFHPVSIPSYNGARKQANLTPLLALLLARQGVPVLVHGVLTDPGRVTSAEIFAALGHAAAHSTAAANQALASARVAFVPTETLAPALARLLALRRVLGVRNSTHTIVKLLQPFDAPALRLVNYTHPPYRDALTTLFRETPADDGVGVLLARGTEGEAVADTRRQVQVDWLRNGEIETLHELSRGVAASASASLSASAPTLAPTAAPASAAESTAAPAAPAASTSHASALPEGRDAAATARWIEAVLAGHAAVPATIADQVQTILRIVARR